ncbi:hypothetical protein Mmc1_1686 [Magnetococcus marinus MC-1]|uniref:Phage antitermination protein Q n=2 Tax=Magnetococcus TaxID=162171 RepID=A0L8A2_MAGMM|nr:hypothetical protein Mmc1_1686 [Magnetococcus marinus MC-1]
MSVALQNTLEQQPSATELLQEWARWSRSGMSSQNPITSTQLLMRRAAGHVGRSLKYENSEQQSLLVDCVISKMAKIFPHEVTLLQEFYLGKKGMRIIARERVFSYGKVQTLRSRAEGLFEGWFYAYLQDEAGQREEVCASLIKA